MRTQTVEYGNVRPLLACSWFLNSNSGDNSAPSTSYITIGGVYRCIYCYVYWFCPYRCV